MPSLADYQVFRDSGLEMRSPRMSEAPDHVSWIWNRPDDLHFTDSVARSPIFSMKVRVFEETKIVVKMNGQPVIGDSPVTLMPDNVKVW